MIIGVDMAIEGTEVQTGVLVMPMPDPEPRRCVCCRAPSEKAFCSRECGRGHLFGHGAEACPHYDYDDGEPAGWP